MVIFGTPDQISEGVRHPPPIMETPRRRLGGLAVGGSPAPGRNTTDRHCLAERRRCLRRYRAKRPPTTDCIDVGGGGVGGERFNASALNNERRERLSLIHI